jgi:hypothetical protein
VCPSPTVYIQTRFICILNAGIGTSISIQSSLTRQESQRNKNKKNEHIHSPTNHHIVGDTAYPYSVRRKRNKHTKLHHHSTTLPGDTAHPHHIQEEESGEKTITERMERELQEKLESSRKNP